MISIYALVVYFFSFVLVGAALAVILMRNPVHSALCLILAFFASAVLWMCLKAEFLSLLLIFVYVGAVMTLFLFVVMMMRIDLERIKKGLKRYGLLSAGMALVFVALMVWLSQQASLAGSLPPETAGGPGNTQLLGTLLYTHYLYAFELAGAILLVAMISAIGLVAHSRQSQRHQQVVAKQYRSNKKDNLRLVDLKEDKS